MIVENGLADPFTQNPFLSMVVDTRFVKRNGLYEIVYVQLTFRCLMAWEDSGASLGCPNTIRLHTNRFGFNGLPTQAPLDPIENRRLFVGVWGPGGLGASVFWTIY